ncbi:hypothetical protein, partial [[Kitasatospora] papulosa]|uniref:hypothetical protein n=1 Tax=[Kitasatospora] papulosa TaxID=1464011 RepID=UPI00364192C4
NDSRPALAIPLHSRTSPIGRIHERPKKSMAVSFSRHFAISSSAEKYLDVGCADSFQHKHANEKERT